MSAHDQDSRELRDDFARRQLDAAFDIICQLAALDSKRGPSAMLDVIAELTERAHEAIDADLVEVSPGSFLPSHEAAQLAAKSDDVPMFTTPEGECPLCGCDCEIDPPFARCCECCWEGRAR